MSGAGAKIKGGYYIRARQEKYSEIAHAPPHVREIWGWLIREANHSGKKKYGEVLERGQVLTTYDEIRDGLHWMVGYRKMRYTKHQCEIAMKFLRRVGRKGSMITTTKTTRGLIITICNYDYYQNPKNYESHNASHNEPDNENGNSPQPPDTIDKNVKNVKKENNTGNEIYDLYIQQINPIRKSKSRALENIKYHTKKYSIDDLKKSIYNYKTIALTSNRTYRKDPANFFGHDKKNQYFIDFLPENFTLPETDKQLDKKFAEDFMRKLNAKK